MLRFWLRHDTKQAIYNGLDMEFGSWTNGLTWSASNAYDNYYLAMEPKEDIKDRLGRSPGKGDALLLTFAFPVSKRVHIPGQQSQQGRAITEYDPYA